MFVAAFQVVTSHIWTGLTRLAVCSSSGENSSAKRSVLYSQRVSTSSLPFRRVPSSGCVCKRLRCVCDRYRQSLSKFAFAVADQLWNVF